MEKKSDKNNIIPFPEERILRNLQEKNDLFTDLPANGKWLDIEDELWAKEDFEKLISFHLDQLREYPKNHFARFSLAQAYFFNYEYEKALETLHKIHIKIPDDQDVLYFIFEILVAAGKNEDDFDWEIKPEITHLDKATMDMCYNLLKPGHKPCFIDDLFTLFADKGFLMFSKEQLLSAIDEDDRFCVKHADSVSTTEIYVTPS
jgi:tetratricopeptide (TPR) repeat protein